jgi:hypothetical protein
LFHNIWRSLGCQADVLNILQGGLRIILTASPRVTVCQSTTAVPAVKEARETLEAEIQELLQKGAISPVPPGSKGFWSTVFLVPKPGGSWRPILNLKPLNQFIATRTFKMDTLQRIRLLLADQRWAVIVDLSDAYFHVPIAPQTHTC